MKLLYLDNRIFVMNKKNKVAVNISDTEQNRKFLENWYFLNNYIDKEPFVDAFYIRCVDVD